MRSGDGRRLDQSLRRRAAIMWLQNQLDGFRSAKKMERAGYSSAPREEESVPGQRGRRSFPRLCRPLLKSDFRGVPAKRSSRKLLARSTGRRSPIALGFQGFEFRAGKEEVSIPRPRSAGSHHATYCKSQAGLRPCDRPRKRRRRCLREPVRRRPIYDRHFREYNCLVESGQESDCAGQSRSSPSRS